MIKKTFIILGIIVLIISCFVIFVLATWNKSYDDTPLPNLTASTDSAIIARGKHLAFGPGHCSSCHVPIDQIDKIKAGLEIPLSGGWVMDIPPGVFRAPNITPDKETGIGNFSDGQLARALRHSVKHDGQILFPFMPFQEMSDEDIIAIISFLRSQESVSNKIEKTEYSFMGKTLLALGLLAPTGPKTTPPKTVKMEPSIAYGKYIANSVANCMGCHTERDLKTGEFTGEPFAGGFRMPPDVYSKGYSFITPNLTPDKETGKIAGWDEKTFVTRFKTGRMIEGSHMPWENFAQLDSIELVSLYQYLTSLKPVKNKIEQIVFEPGEEFPKK